MIYRDRSIDCPRCGVELVRDDRRELWRCGKCQGFMVAVEELIRLLLAAAPDLLPAGGVRSLPTIGRRTVAPKLPCSSCGEPMEPVFLGGVELDRCYRDEQIWFDAGELALVVEITRTQRDERDDSDVTWLRRLLAFLSVDTTRPG